MESLRLGQGVTLTGLGPIFDLSGGPNYGDATRRRRRRTTMTAMADNAMAPAATRTMTRVEFELVLVIPSAATWTVTVGPRSPLTRRAARRTFAPLHTPRTVTADAGWPPPTGAKVSRSRPSAVRVVTVVSALPGTGRHDTSSTQPLRATLTPEGAASAEGDDAL